MHTYRNLIHAYIYMYVYINMHTLYIHGPHTLAILDTCIHKPNLYT